jgi:hypothetical protein
LYARRAYRLCKAWPRALRPAARDGDVGGRLFAVGPPALTQKEAKSGAGHRDADVSFDSELDVELF